LLQRGLGAKRASPAKQPLELKMTISELINGKLKRAKMVGLFFWLAFAATFFLPDESSDLIKFFPLLDSWARACI
jgi:hypothetical protein